jgi:hypothetical protein
MGIMNRLKKIARKNPFTAKNIQSVIQLINDPKLSRTYYPELPRKSKFTILKENLVWLAKHNEVNKYYYVYGFDRIDRSNYPEVIPIKKFTRIRNRRNIHLRKEAYFNYVCILRDKFVFSQFLTSLGFPTPKNILLVNTDQVTWLSDMRTAPLSTIIENPELNINGFCKKLTGILGEGAFALSIKNGKLYIKEKEVTLDEFKQIVSNKEGDLYLLQERIIQHPKMSELHPDSVNTIRMNTFNNNGKVEVFSAALRIGAKGSSVDNWAAGGIVVGIDLETGKLKTEGLFKPGYGGRVQSHPDTGIVLQDFEIPFFSECLTQAHNLHSYLYGIHSIGWDIAITENGPTFIEGNDDWEGGIPMVLEKNFRSRFMKNYV